MWQYPKQENGGRWGVKQVVNHGFKGPCLVDVCKAIGIGDAGLGFGWVLHVAPEESDEKNQPETSTHTQNSTPKFGTELRWVGRLWL